MRRLIMSLVWNLITGTALSAPVKSLILRGVDVEDASAARGVVLKVEVECGERLEGILVREQDDNVGIAVAVERPEVRCTGGVETRELTIPFIDPKGKDIVGLPADDADAKVVLQDATINSSGPAGLSVQWDHVCRPAIGILLMPKQDGTVGVAAALAGGASARKARGVSCAGGREAMTLRSIHTNNVNWSVIDRPGKLEDLYAVRVVAPQQVHVTANGQLSMSWQRRCREIALGVLFGEESPSSVAVVTAYLPNVTCRGSRMLSETMTIDALTLARGARLTPMTPDKAIALNKLSYGFRLVAPEKIEFAGMQKNLVIRASASCGKRLGMVIGKDSIGNVAMANLISVESGACSVKSMGTKSTLPLRVATDLNPRIFPLRVMGSMAH